MSTWLEPVVCTHFVHRYTHRWRHYICLRLDRDWMKRRLLSFGWALAILSYIIKYRERVDKNSLKAKWISSLFENPLHLRWESLHYTQTLLPRLLHILDADKSKMRWMCVCVKLMVLHVLRTRKGGPPRLFTSKSPENEGICSRHTAGRPDRVRRCWTAGAFVSFFRFKKGGKKTRGQQQ